MYQQRSMGDQLADFGTGLTLSAMSFGVLIFILLIGGILFLPIYLLMRRTDSNDEAEQAALQREAPEAPHRLFDAPAHEQWLNAYDYWLYKLEDATNIAFSQSPEGSFSGALIVTSAPAVVFALPYALFDGVPGLTPFWVVLAITLIFGGFAGYRLTQPAKLFPGDVHGSLTQPRSQKAEATTEQEEKGFIIGEDL